MESKAPPWRSHGKCGRSRAVISNEKHNLKTMQDCIKQWRAALTYAIILSKFITLQMNINLCAVLAYNCPKTARLSKSGNRQIANSVSCEWRHKWIGIRIKASGIENFDGLILSFYY